MDQKWQDRYFLLSEQIVCVITDHSVSALNDAAKQAGISVGTSVWALLDTPIPAGEDGSVTEFQANFCRRPYRIRVLWQGKEAVLSLFPTAGPPPVPNTLSHTAGSIRRSLQDLNTALDVLSDQLDLEDSVTNTHASMAMRSLFQLQRTATLLDLYHKLNTNNYQSEPSFHDLNSTVTKLVEEARDLFLPLGITLQSSLPPQRVFGYVDWRLLEFLIWELLGNAAGHSSTSLLHLTMRQTQDEQIVFTVSNSSPDALPEQLYQRHAAAPEEFSGSTGLGLSVLQAGAKYLGGNLLLSQTPEGNVRAVMSIHAAKNPDPYNIGMTPTAYTSIPISLLCLSQVLPLESYDLRDFF